MSMDFEGEVRNCGGGSMLLSVLRLGTFDTRASLVVSCRFSVPILWVIIVVSVYCKAVHSRMSRDFEMV